MLAPCCRRALGVLQSLTACCVMDDDDVVHEALLCIMRSAKSLAGSVGLKPLTIVYSIV